MKNGPQQWVRAIRTSDPEAFRALYRALNRPLLRYAWTLTRDDDLIYDIVQDAFLKLWQMRTRLDPDRSVQALLFRMVRNLALKSRRRRRYEQPEADVPEPQISASAPQTLDAERMTRHLQTWIAEMPPRRREVFELSRISGLSHREIATVLELSPKTVNNHLVEALRFLREQLRASGHDPDAR